MTDKSTATACDLTMQTTPLPQDPVLAMAYVPYQQWHAELLTPENALATGTLFPVLDKPFLRGKGAKS